MSYKTGFSFIRRKHRPVVDNITLSVNPGENVGILGGNGAGKSTLLKLISGIYSPDKGKISYPSVIRIAFVGLQSGFIAHLNGWQNITLTGLLIGMSKSEIKRKISEIAEYTELGARLYDPLYTYSTGMRARLAFSVSIHSDPNLLIVDEAMGVGDKSFRRKSSKSLKELIGGKCAAIIVSHELKYLESICDKMLWVESGRVVKQGDTKLVLEEYMRS